MGYRRPHHRRAHTRTNSDGSKSSVSESFVKGHNYDRKMESKSQSCGTTSEGGLLSAILLLFGGACFILCWLGILLGWDSGEVLFYGCGFLVSLIVFFVLSTK